MSYKEDEELDCSRDATVHVAGVAERGAVYE